jgi:penicillin-binding protein 1A
MVLAMALERKFSKRQILELYLNKVYFGGGAYGIDAASRKFFGHSATTLDLPEAAIIAGLVKAPSRYSPTADAEGRDWPCGRGAGDARQWRDQPGTRRRSTSQGVKLAPEPPQNSVRYFTDWALPQLDVLIDDRTSRSRSGPPSTSTCSARRPPRSRPMCPRARRVRWCRSTATGRCGRWSAAPIM